MSDAPNQPEPSASLEEFIGHCLALADYKEDEARKEGWRSQDAEAIRAVDAALQAERTANAEFRTGLIECFKYLSREIALRPLNETACDGTQALSAKVAKVLDLTAPAPT